MTCIIRGADYSRHKKVNNIRHNILADKEKQKHKNVKKNNTPPPIQEEQTNFMIMML